MPFTPGIGEFEVGVCKALGLDPAYVIDVVLRIAAGETPTITVKMWPDAEQLKAIGQEVDKVSWPASSALTETREFALRVPGN